MYAIDNYKIKTIIGWDLSQIKVHLMCVANNSHTPTDEQSIYRGFAYVSLYVHY